MDKIGIFLIFWWLQKKVVNLHHSIHGGQIWLLATTQKKAKIRVYTRKYDKSLDFTQPVSNKHLTLPTIRSV
ncbi:MAG: hypothetical protein K2N79_02865, partial [Muribaculaceae bacterium]|nr:hypothetical protein [Muribaculaceae bacterium]